MRTAVALVAAFFASLYLAAPAPAADEGGEVKEIIIKIQTEDGEKWFRLGKDLEAINIHEGDYVQFDYADEPTTTPLRPSKSKRQALRSRVRPARSDLCRFSLIGTLGPTPGFRWR
jgi:hypothetical protein